MPSYTLSPRQTRAFSQTFNLYRPDASTKRTGTSSTIGKVGAKLMASGIKGRIMSTPDNGAPSPTGRINTDNLETTDRLRLHSSEVCADSWYVYETGSATWYAVMGDSKLLHFKASEQVFLIKRISAPEIIP
jgi:hypothetical protein